jgi:predicted DNA-binding protein with PD1-like motif
MRSREVRTGRTIVAVFEHGEDLYAALDETCTTHDIRHGYIPMFIAGLSRVDLVGTCERLADPAAPVWSKVQLSNIEAVGAGTLAWDETAERVAPHIHVTVGLKEHSATGHTSHLLGATVQFLTEMVIVEVLEPALLRRRDAALYDVPLLQFGDSAS